MQSINRWVCGSVSMVLAVVAAVAFAAAEIPGGPLVSTDWLAQNIDHPNLRIIEISVNPGVYERGHIPGAVNFSWRDDLNDRVKRDIVGQDVFEALLSKAGVGPDTTVILYGDTNNWFAAWGGLGIRSLRRQAR